MTPAGHNNMHETNWTLGSFITSAIATVGGWTINEWLSVAGFVVMLFTVWMQWRRDQREAEYHRWQSANLLKPEETE